MKEEIYVTETGVSLKLAPVRQVLLAKVRINVEQELRKAGKPVDPPMYTLTNVVGEPETFPLSEDTLEVADDPQLTQLNKARWAKYQKVLSEIERIVADQTFLLTLKLGVQCDVPDDGWDKTLEKEVGMTFDADDPMDRKAKWLMYCVLTPYDLQMLPLRMNTLSVGKMVKAEDVAAFLRTVDAKIETASHELFTGLIEKANAVGSDTDEVTGDDRGDGVGDKES